MAGPYPPALLAQVQGEREQLTLKMRTGDPARVARAVAQHWTYDNGDRFMCPCSPKLSSEYVRGVVAAHLANSTRTYFGPASGFGSWDANELRERLGAAPADMSGGPRAPVCGRERHEAIA